jgi:hypothetical protein
MDLIDSTTLDGWWALSQDRYLHRATNTEEMQADMHASSEIRTHTPSVRAGEDIVNRVISSKYISAWRWSYDRNI